MGKKIHQHVPRPPLPDPVTQLNLPNYNLGSLDDRETRTVYIHGELEMRRLNERLMGEGVSAEQRARRMCDLRNALRSWTRDLMLDRAYAEELTQYEKNLSFDGLVTRNQTKRLTGDEVYNAIIESSTRSRPEPNKDLNIDPEKPPSLPPVWPSHPIWGLPTPLKPQPTPPPPMIGDEGF